MKLAIISFAREGSKRLPGKNTMLLNGKPLIWYTLQTMKYLRDFFARKMQSKGIYIEDCYYVLTDYEECIKECDKENINTIWRNHPKNWDDTKLNQWAHNIIQANAYLLLQPTSPFRNNNHIMQTLSFCIESKLNSAYMIYNTKKLNYKRTGSFFYYTPFILASGRLYNHSSIMFQDTNDIDIDTIEDFRKAEEYAKQNNYGVLL